jgi:hypothetical protein
MAGMASGLAPFPLGQTYYNGATPPTTYTDTTVSLEGMVRTFENRSPGAPITIRHGGQIECVLVRNTSGVALLPSQAVIWQSGYSGQRVDGLVCTTAGEVAGIVDDSLPATGVPDDDLFWLMRRGKVLALTSREADASSTIATRANLVARTAATSQCTTAGRLQITQIVQATSTAIGSVIEDNITNRVGKAVSARASTQTSTTILIDLNLSN